MFHEEYKKKSFLWCFLKDFIVMLSCSKPLLATVTLSRQPLSLQKFFCPPPHLLFPSFMDGK